MDKFIVGLLVVFIVFAIGFDNFYIGEQIVVPVRVHLISDDSGAYSTFRDEREIVEVFDEVNEIWESAGIYFSVEEIVRTEVGENAIPNAINGNYLELFNEENVNHEIVNLFAVRSLNGINGLALVNFNSVLLSDRTSGGDGRTIAHELGHILGLKHTEDKERLMSQQSTGRELSLGEIRGARSGAAADL